MEVSEPLSAPVPLADHHQLDTFNSGVSSLDDWLRRRAAANQTQGASRTYVACERQRVVAYYALASGSVNAAAASGRLRRNMPDPVPVVILGRLAVDRAYHGKGLGRALFQDAVKRVLLAADVIGIRGLLVNAISDDARAFYLALGMSASPLDPMTLMVTLADLRASL
jgi:GNAT superfamily N-acetyltransferase